MNDPWHLLVYIAADNSLYDNALVSLRQLTEGSPRDSVKITVQFEGPTPDEVARYSCAGGERKIIPPLAAGFGTTPEERLTNFLAAALQNTGNERIFLILWGHGAGIDHVYLYSDPNDSASTARKAARKAAAPKEGAAAEKAEKAARKAARAVPSHLLNPNSDDANRYVKDIKLGSILSKNKLRHKIEILGFDSCLMGMAEICHQVAGNVDLVIASDEEIPDASWPYDTILQDLTRFPDMDSSTLSVAIVSRFMERYAEESKRTRISLSVYRARESANKLATAVKEFAGEVTKLTTETRPDAKTVRSRILIARDMSRTPEVADYIDLGVFCSEIIRSFEGGEKIRTYAEEIRKVLVETPYLLYHRDAGPEEIFTATGLAVYFPQRIPPATSAAIKSIDEQTMPHLRDYEPSQPPSERTKTLLFKTPPSRTTKTPPSRTTKNTGLQTVERQLIGSEVLWCDYVNLKFNKNTGWAEMVEKLITGTLEQTTECTQAAPVAPPARTGTYTQAHVPSRVAQNAPRAKKGAKQSNR